MTVPTAKTLQPTAAARAVLISSGHQRTAIAVVGPLPAAVAELCRSAHSFGGEHYDA